MMKILNPKPKSPMSNHLKNCIVDLGCYILIDNFYVTAHDLKNMKPSTL